MNSFLPKRELLLIALFAACVAFQVFLPPSIGLANNGDFGKMVARFGMGPAEGDAAEEYRFTTLHWIYDHKFYWLADERSTELLPITFAVFLGWEFSRQNFDIRVVGAIHALLWISCFAGILPLLRSLGGWRWYAAALCMLFVLTDVSYVAYCNTFYRDVASFLFLTAAITLWLHAMVRGRPSWKLFAWFCVASILCVVSKPQHALLGLFLFAAAAGIALSFPNMSRKVAACVLSLSLLGTAWFTFFQSVEDEKQGQVYSVIFMKILHNSPAPLADAQELGLNSDDLRFIDFWPKQDSDHPLRNPQWAAEFRRRTGQGAIARFYLHHPWRALTIVYRDLHLWAMNRRPSGFGNYEKAAGYPPGAQTNAFGWWSLLRSVLFRFAPWHIVVWYAIFLAAATWALKLDWRIGLLAILIAGMGLTELAVSTLGDAGETDRHLFLFHVLTDFTMLLALVVALHRTGQGRASLRASS